MLCDLFRVVCAELSEALEDGMWDSFIEKATGWD
jgi:hypothetical protein